MLRSIATRSALLALAALTLFVAPAAAVPAVSGEFPVSDLNSNNKLAQGPDGNMWVTLAGVDDVARLTPDGSVTEFDLGVEGASGIASAGNRLWVTYNTGVVSFEPGDPEGTKDPTTIATITGNHSIVLAPDGNLWVATTEKLIRISPADTADRKEFAVTGLGPRDIDVAGSLLVIADFGEARVLTATLADPPVRTEYKLNGGSQGVAGSPTGLIALTQQGQMPTEFGLLAPPGPPLLTQSPGTDPFGVAAGADGAFWVAQFNTSTVTRLGADNVATTLAPGFAPASGPRQIAAGPGNTLWVTLETAKKIGRVSGLEPPVVGPLPPAPASAPRTRIKGGPKGKLTTRKAFRAVTFGFDSPDPVTAFECRLRKLSPKGKAKAKGKGAKGSARAKAPRAPRFKRCASPKGYKARPGRYRFEVRAVNAAGPDKSPAKRGFRVVRVTG